MWPLVRDTFKEFSEDECPQMAASLAYYTVFSLPALLVLIVAIVGFFATEEQAAERMTNYFEESVGKTGATQINTMLEQANKPGRGVWGSVMGIAILLIGATGALAQLQTALNRVWEVKPDPKSSGIWHFIIKRVLSLGMILGIAFLLLASLVVSWVLNEFSHFVEAWAPSWLSSNVLLAIHWGLTLAIISLLFASILKYVPDAKIEWTDAWRGGLLTAVLFMIGKFAISAYLAFSDPTNAYGAAGSLAVILIWIYYSSMILFLGAEFTQVFARHRGKPVEPEPGAIRIRRTQAPA